MKILSKLTIKHLMMNKKRTIVTIIGIILSTALMVGIGLLFASFRSYMIEDFEKRNGSHHLKISNLKQEDYEYIKSDKNVKKIAYESAIGFSLLKESKNDYKPYLYISGANKEFLASLILVEGRLPNNDKEVVISDHIEKNGLVKYKIGDVLDLEIGNRCYDEEIIYTNTPLITEDDKNIETLKIFIEKEYEIVGIIERPYSEDYSAPGYSVFTWDDFNNDANVYLTLLLKDFYKNSESLLSNLNLSKEVYGDNVHYFAVDYNNSLLSLYGINKYDNYNLAIVKIIIIMLSIISVGCILVIYNSFAISVMERKKQFGLFSSIGATKKQLRKTIFYEAFIIGLIGIPLGVLSAFIGIGSTLFVINSLLANTFNFNLKLAVYPLFIIIPIIFMIIVIFISAFRPSRVASKISPIKAIRLNDDIKIKPKEIKIPSFIYKLLGMEGVLAYKSIKRNKKKYRITIASLFISIVMFLSFSSFLQYGEESSKEFLNEVDYDLLVSISTNDKIYNNLFNDIKMLDTTTDLLSVDGLVLMLEENVYHKDYQKVIDLYKENDTDNLRNIKGYSSINVLGVDKDSYNKYKAKFNLKEDKPFLINQFIEEVYLPKKHTKITGKYFKDPKNIGLELYTYDFNDEKATSVTKITDFVILDNVPFGLKTFLLTGPIIILPNDMFLELKKEVNKNEEEDYLYYGDLRIKTDDYKLVNKTLEKYESLEEVDDLYIDNVILDRELENKLLLVVKILLYGFISLVTLIGVTSVFNTINTSIALRRKEFAILRSVGLSLKGFKRMLRLESLIIGVKSLFYGIVVSIGIIILIHYATSDVISFSTIMFPWKYFLMAIIGVFIIIFIIMVYATKKVKQENIIDTIREENI